MRKSGKAPLLRKRNHKNEINLLYYNTRCRKYQQQSFGIDGIAAIPDRVHNWINHIARV
jgi:hypothetical protein